VKFITGGKQISKRILVEFNNTNTAIIASTCPMILTLPCTDVGYDTFSAAMKAVMTAGLKSYTMV